MEKNRTKRKIKVWKAKETNYIIIGIMGEPTIYRDCYNLTSIWKEYKAYLYDGKKLKEVPPTLE